MTFTKQFVKRPVLLISFTKQFFKRQVLLMTFIKQFFKRPVLLMTFTKQFLKRPVLLKKPGSSVVVVPLSRLPALLLLLSRPDAGPISLKSTFVPPVPLPTKFTRRGNRTSI